MCQEKRLERELEVHAVEDLESQARKSGHYYKQRGVTELSSRDGKT